MRLVGACLLPGVAANNLTINRVWGGGGGGNYRWPSLPEFENCRSSCLSLQGASLQLILALCNFAVTTFSSAGTQVGAKLRCCVKVEVDVLGSPSIISLMVSVDVKHHEIRRGLVVVVKGVMRGGGGGGTIFQ